MAMALQHLVVLFWDVRSRWNYRKRVIDVHPDISYFSTLRSCARGGTFESRVSASPIRQSSS